MHITWVCPRYYYHCCTDNINNSNDSSESSSTPNALHTRVLVLPPSLVRSLSALLSFITHLLGAGLALQLLDDRALVDLEVFVKPSRSLKQRGRHGSRSAKYLRNDPRPSYLDKEREGGGYSAPFLSCCREPAALPPEPAAPTEAH